MTEQCSVITKNNKNYGLLSKIVKSYLVNGRGVNYL